MVPPLVRKRSFRVSKHGRKKQKLNHCVNEKNNHYSRSETGEDFSTRKENRSCSEVAHEKYVEIIPKLFVKIKILSEKIPHLSICEGKKNEDQEEVPEDRCETNRECENLQRPESGNTAPNPPTEKISHCNTMRTGNESELTEKRTQNVPNFPHGIRRKQEYGPEVKHIDGAENKMQTPILNLFAEKVQRQEDTHRMSNLSISPISPCTKENILHEMKNNTAFLFSDYNVEMAREESNTRSKNLKETAIHLVRKGKEALEIIGGEPPADELFPTPNLDSGPLEEAKYAPVNIEHLLNPHEESVCGIPFIRPTISVFNDSDIFDQVPSGTAFSEFSQLSQKEHSPQKEGVNNECLVCLKSFASRTQLAIHKRIHSGEKSHECEVCEKLFSSRKTLVYHMRFHKGKKEYYCEFCGKTSFHKGNFAYHMRIHTGEKPYECDICEMRFTGKGNLNHHMKKHLVKKQ